MRAARPGRERHVVRLMKQGKQAEALAYMKRHGMTQAFGGAPESMPIGSISVNIATDEVKPAGLSEADKELGRAFAEAPKPDIPGDPNYKYPEYKPVREPVPPGVRWAIIRRELAHNNQKVIQFEDDNREAILWMTMREIMDYRRKGRLIGMAFPVKKNVDEKQGGFAIWHG